MKLCVNGCDAQLHMMEHENNQELWELMLTKIKLVSFSPLSVRIVTYVNAVDMKAVLTHRRHVARSASE